MKPREWIAAGAGALATVVFYASVLEPRWLQLRRRRIHIRSLPKALEGLKIGVLSDLHIERGRSTRTVGRAVDLLMREAPDLIAVTGDFAEDEAGLQAVLGALEPLRAPLGVYAVPGNHDHHAGIDLWHAAVAERPWLIDLTNRYEMLERGPATVCVGGVDDFSEGRPRLILPPPPSRAFTLVLAHSPDQAERCRRGYDAVDLIVSGHTHGGQIRLPFLSAPVNSARYPDLYEEGLRRRPWTQVYTSRGLGTSSIHARFFARPEVTLLQLTSRPRPAR